MTLEDQARQRRLCSSISRARERTFSDTPTNCPPLPNYSLLTTHDSLNPLKSALAKNKRVTLLESALPNSLDLKSFRIRTYKKRWGEGVERLTNEIERVSS